MAKLLANHPMEGDFAVDLTEGVITAAARPDDRKDITKVAPKKDRELVTWLNSQRAVLTINPLDIYDDDEDASAEPVAAGATS